MKRIFLVLLSLLLLAFSCFCCACENKESAVSETENSAEEESAPPETEPEKEEEKPVKKSLKLLAIGNSFSIDGLEYVYDIAKSVGIDDVIIGNLYIGGCSLQTHAENIAANAKAYRYFRNDSGYWQDSLYQNTAVSDVIGTEEWDYVSLQQASHFSGVESSYDPYLADLISYVTVNAPSAKIVWHMTWAYPHNSAYAPYANYGYDQTVMYDSIVNAVKHKVLNRSEIYNVITTGTAVQNVRTSYFGDNLSRDELHLTVNEGRFLASLCWVKQLTGADISNVEFGRVSERFLRTAKEAVNNAYVKPYEVTRATDVYTGKITSQVIKNILAENGMDYNDYYALNCCFFYSGYYNSADGSNMINIYTTENVDPSFLAKFVCTGRFRKSEIPEGSIIVVGNGYQYRPDAWTSLTAVNPSRPGNVSQNIVTVNSEWWGSYNYRAFNISKTGTPTLSKEEMDLLTENFAILVPKTLL